jgi:hypothetical protein
MSVIHALTLRPAIAPSDRYFPCFGQLSGSCSILPIPLPAFGKNVDDEAVVGEVNAILQSLRPAVMGTAAAAD